MYIVVGPFASICHLVSQLVAVIITPKSIAVSKQGYVNTIKLLGMKITAAPLRLLTGEGGCDVNHGRGDEWRLGGNRTAVLGARG